jgi:hypothetical protein
VVVAIVGLVGDVLQQMAYTNVWLIAGGLEGLEGSRRGGSSRQ